MNQNKKIDGPVSVRPGQPGQPSANEDFTPKTTFGQELWALRQKAVAEGLSLMTNEEILAEIESRRYGRLTESHD